MLDGKSIVFAAGLALAVTAFGPGRTGGSPVREGDLNAQAARSTAIDAHKTITYRFTVTNTTGKAQMVESVRTSCACLKVKADAQERVPPGGVLPFDVVFDPAGMEGPVQKRVWVTLAPSKQIVTFAISENVRLRLGFKPMDAAFGVIKRSETGREITSKLSGYAADGAKLGMPIALREGKEQTDLFAANAAHDSANAVRREQIRLLSRSDNRVNSVKNNSIFDVRLGADGKSVVAKFNNRNVLPGIYSETWTIPTSDKEIPEIKFVVSARVADAVSVTPQVIMVGWDETVCSRMVMVRGDFSHKDHKERFKILSAETKPRKWGDVKITQRPMNGWRIDVENIDPSEVRQFSKRPFLEVKTNLPEMESFEIPLRVMQNGGAE